MPVMGEAIGQGISTKWVTEVGGLGDRDEALFEISTDKVDAEIPSPAAGTLSEVRFKEGETVEVNTVVAVLDGDQSAAAAAPAAKPVEEKPARPAPPPPQPVTTPAPPPPAPTPMPPVET